MNTRKTLPTMTKPFAHVHSTLTALGFTETPSREGCLYEVVFRDPVSQKQYSYRIPTRTQEDGQTEVLLGDAGFHGDEQQVPAEAEAAAKEMLTELMAYLANEPRRRRRPGGIGHTMNGTMAGTEEDMVRLGKIMSSLPTNSQVRASGMVPDPIQ